MVVIDTDSWAAIDGSAAMAALLFCWLYVSFAYSVAFLLFGFTSLKFVSPKPGWLAFLIVPSLWILTEFLRSYFYSIFTWGPEAMLGAHWNFGNLGFAAIGTPLSYASRFVGLFGLSFLVVSINIACLQLLQKKYKAAVVVLSACCLLAFIGAHTFTAQQKPVPVGLVQLKNTLQITDKS